MDGGEEGLLDGIHRTTVEGWEVIGRRHRRSVLEGADRRQPGLRGPVVALRDHGAGRDVPLGPRRPWLRPLLALYPLAMGLTLMATGEHYFFDVLLGWIYAGS